MNTESRKLKTGVAYHGNRMPSHAYNDMREIVNAGMDIVVHMLSHTDWDRHKTVMRDIFAISEDMGLEVWVDNWGLGGVPGDKSRFLCYEPDSHMVYNNGEIDPSQACLNSPSFRRFVKDWLDMVVSIGGKTIFWDEPLIPFKKASQGNGEVIACYCPRCRKLFAEQYGYPMPEVPDNDVKRFRTDTIVEYFREITAYSASLGLKNTVCVMLKKQYGISLDTLDRICALPQLDNIGSDPYWFSKPDANPYEYVYRNTKENLDICRRFGKDHNIWIQAYNAPAGREEEIIQATEAAYDAGARTILAWGFHGCESNDYRSANPERSWACTVEAMKRVRSMEYDRILRENRARYADFVEKKK